MNSSAPGCTCMRGSGDCCASKRFFPTFWFIVMLTGSPCTPSDHLVAVFIPHRHNFTVVGIPPSVRQRDIEYEMTLEANEQWGCSRRMTPYAGVKVIGPGIKAIG